MRLDVFFHIEKGFDMAKTVGTVESGDAGAPSGHESNEGGCDIKKTETIPPADTSAAENEEFVVDTRGDRPAVYGDGARIPLVRKK